MRFTVIDYTESKYERREQFHQSQRCHGTSQHEGRFLGSVSTSPSNTLLPALVNSAVSSNDVNLELEVAEGREWWWCPSTSVAPTRIWTAHKTMWSARRHTNRTYVFSAHFTPKWEMARPQKAKAHGAQKMAYDVVGEAGVRPDCSTCPTLFLRILLHQSGGKVRNPRGHKSSQTNDYMQNSLGIAAATIRPRPATCLGLGSLCRFRSPSKR